MTDKLFTMVVRTADNVFLDSHTEPGKTLTVNTVFKEKDRAEGWVKEKFPGCTILGITITELELT